MRLSRRDQNWAANRRRQAIPPSNQVCRTYSARRQNYRLAREAEKQRETYFGSVLGPCRNRWFNRCW